MFPDKACHLKSKWLDSAALSLVNHASANATLKKISSVKLILDQQKEKPKVIGAPDSGDFEVSANVAKSKYYNFWRIKSKKEVGEKLIDWKLQGFQKRLACSYWDLYWGLIPV